jgi:hypothetical protein
MWKGFGSGRSRESQSAVRFPTEKGGIQMKKKLLIPLLGLALATMAISPISAVAINELASFPFT